jgi:hypothetical protein
MMPRSPLILLALFVPAFAKTAVPQELSPLSHAKVTRNDRGEITSVRLTGKSNRDRFAVTPETIKAIAALDNLEYLSFWGTTVADDDIRRLTHLKKLQLIDLTFTDVTGESLQALSQLPALVSLRVEGCHVTDDELAPLADMPQLAMLYLGRTKVSDAGLKHLRGLKKLTTLQLSDCRITDEGLASLGNLPQIQHLWLSKTVRYGDDDRSDLTDACVDYLITLDTLTDLRIGDSRISDQGLERLRKGLPNTKISTERTGVTYLGKPEE